MKKKYEYDVYFCLYGKKMKTTVLAENEIQAKEIVKNKIVFDKVIKSKSDFNSVIDMFKDILG